MPICWLILDLTAGSFGRLSSFEPPGQLFGPGAARAETGRLEAVLEHVRVGALDEHLVRLVHGQHDQRVVLACNHLKQREVRELGAAVSDVDQLADVPSLSVNHINTIGLSDEQN